MSGPVFTEEQRDSLADAYKAIRESADRRRDIEAEATEIAMYILKTVNLPAG